MTSTHWDLVYGRPPLSRDAILFGIALALHLPLLLLQFKAPIKTKNNDQSLYVIDMRDKAIDQIIARGMVLPPPIRGEKVIKQVDLSGLILHAQRPPQSFPPPNVTHIKMGINKGLTPSLVSPKIEVGLPESLTAGASLAPLPGGESRKVKEDKGRFLLAANTIRSLDSGIGQSLAVASQPKTIRLPTAAVGQAESGRIKSPVPLTGKVLVAGLGTTEPVVQKSAIKTDTRAGMAIAGLDKADTGVAEELSPVRSHPDAATLEKQTKELFPIHGALKDRVIDKQEIPDYPEWARKKGTASSVKFRFSVTADGHVKENIEILQGTGYPELDNLARAALLRWVFSPLPPEKGNIVQDGIIEFRFSVK